MKIKVELEMDVAEDGAIAKCLRGKALAMFKARKARLANPDKPVPDELKAEFDSFTEPLDTAVKKLLGTIYECKVGNVHFESLDVVSKEEQATILAPEG